MSSSNEGRKRKKRKKSPVRTFFTIVISIVLVFVLLTSAFVFAYNKIMGKDDTGGTGGVNIVDSIIGKGIELNVAVFGVDKDETRTDVIFVVHFDSKDKSLRLMSVPRDTKVELSDEVTGVLDSAGRNYNSVTKINAVHAYGGKEHNAEVAVLQLEDLLGINIDHYVKVNLEAFRQIVDAIGGVEIDVPQRMFYKDPYQDLYIDLQPGLQNLNGDKAEQLVRFRSYPEGDVARVEVQQLFLQEFAKKILSTQTILSNLPDLISVMFEYVNTDVSLTDALKYSRYIKDIDMHNISMETLPGAGKTIDDVSYFVIDETEFQASIDRIFYGKQPNVDTSSKSLNIEVANGGIIEGLAGNKRDMLEEEGYNIIGVSTFSGEKTDNTRIVVKEEGMGEDLIYYFKNAVVEVDSNLLDSGTDIKIILGLEEK